MILMKKKNKYQKLVQKFVEKENIAWSREIKIAVELYSYCPEENFWEQLELGFMLKSLAWFKRKWDGEKRLRKEYTLFKLSAEKEKIKLEEKPVVTIENKQDKPKDVLEFIEGY